MGLLCAGTVLSAADGFYAGGLGGVATLSPDARSSISSNEAQTSLYNPANGPALNLFAGWLLSDYLSLQINYVRNGNDLTLVSTSATGQGLTAFQQARTSSQNSFELGDRLPLPHAIADVKVNGLETAPGALRRRLPVHSGQVSGEINSINQITLLRRAPIWE